MQTAKCEKNNTFKEPPLSSPLGGHKFTVTERK